MTSVALGDVCLCFAWQAWHLWHWAGSGGALGPDWSPVTPRLCLAGDGTWRHIPSFCVAGKALGDEYVRFAWQAWHLWHWAGSVGALGPDWSPVTPRDFAWQAWHLATYAFVLRGRQGTW